MRERKLYSLAEIERLHLPGYRNTSSLNAALSDPESAWDAVLSASIFTTDEDGTRKVLTGIRREETHRTHPGVVSTPTMRLPNTLAHSIVRRRLEAMGGRYPSFVVPKLDPEAGLVPKTVKTLPDKTGNFNREPFPNRRSDLPFAVGSMLGQKLSAASRLEMSPDGSLGTVSLSAIMAGFSHATTERGTDYFEPLIMLGATVELGEPDIIPQDTESYRNVGFVPVTNFLEGHTLRNANTLVPSLREGDEIDVCVKGMCLATTREVIGGGEPPRLLAATA